jgi:hypothetical protein
MNDSSRGIERLFSCPLMKARNSKNASIASRTCLAWRPCGNTQWGLNPVGVNATGEHAHSSRSCVSRRVGTASRYRGAESLARKTPSRRAFQKNPSGCCRRSLALQTHPIEFGGSERHIPEAISTETPWRLGFSIVADWHLN